MNCILEPQCAPTLPDFMLLDEEDGCADAWPTLGLASFAPLCSAAMPVPASAPVPIAAACSRRAHSGDLVDSLESTQTLLGASLHDSGATGMQMNSHTQHTLRFVPVSVSPPPPVPAYLYQQQPQYQQQAQQQQYQQAQQQYHQQQEQYSQYSLLPAEADLLFGGYGVVAPAQPAFQPPQHAQHAQQAAWELPSPTAYQAPTLEHQQQQAMLVVVQQETAADMLQVPVAAAAGATAAAGTVGGAGISGISSFELQYGFSTQFGQQLPIPSARDDRMRRAMSEEALQIGSYRGFGNGALATVAEGDSSEGSDVDTLGQHHQRGAAPARGLHLSRSAPTASHMTLERSGSTRRLGGHNHNHHALAAAQRSSLNNTPSPRTICLKIKAGRPRPPAAARAAGAAALASCEPEASPRPARFAARRSMALSAAAVADDEEEFVMADSDSDDPCEPAVSAGASEERRSGGSSNAGGSALAAAAGGGSNGGGNGKKKHNPWSLTETEALVEGVRLLGPSKWAEIKKLGVGGIAEILVVRSAVDLKDKWRNLTRVAKLPKSVLKARAHKSSSEIPLDLLLSVKDLMEMSRE